MGIKIPGRCNGRTHRDLTPCGCSARGSGTMFGKSLRTPFQLPGLSAAE